MCCKRTNYSAGAPATKRIVNLSANTILVGVIPGEPKILLNTFIEPLIDDQMKLWNDVVMKLVSQKYVGGVIIRHVWVECTEYNVYLKVRPCFV